MAKVKIKVVVGWGVSPLVFWTIFAIWIGCLYWKQILTGASLALAISAMLAGLWAAGWGIAHHSGEVSARREADRVAAEVATKGLRRRADEQNAWVYSGDPRGVFGHDWRPSGEGP